jgi:hypothetical protein
MVAADGILFHRSQHNIIARMSAYVDISNETVQSATAIKSIHDQVRHDASLIVIDRIVVSNRKRHGSSRYGYVFLDAVWPAFENRSRICDRIKGWDFLANGNLGVKLHVVLGAMAGEEVPRVVNRIY